MFIAPLSPEVTVPVSLKEVGGYIEKQVAYLSGEAWLHDLSIHHPFASFFQTSTVVFLLSRGPRGRVQRHHHPPRMLRFQRHSRGSFGQSLFIPDSHPSVRPPPPPPPPAGGAPLYSAVHQKSCHMHSEQLKCLLSVESDTLSLPRLPREQS